MRVLNKSISYNSDDLAYKKVFTKTSLDYIILDNEGNQV